MNAETAANRPPKPAWVPWFWEMPDFELDDQIEQYDTLGWTRSHRKLSSLLLWFQAAIVLVLGIVGLIVIGIAVGSAVVYTLLGLGVLSGNRAALSITMLVFTLDRAASIAVAFFNPLVWLVGIAWWALFMERFWRAYDVSRARAWRRRRAAGVPTPAPVRQVEKGVPPE